VLRSADLPDGPVPRALRSRLLLIGVLATAVLAALILAIRRVQPEPVFEPGLEFNPDFDLTVDEILADIRGESPHA